MLDFNKTLLYLLDPTGMSCANAGLSPGCCEWRPFSSCRTSEGCYCDRKCRKFGDCCPDAHRRIRCPSDGEIRMLIC